MESELQQEQELLERVCTGAGVVERIEEACERLLWQWLEQQQEQGPRREPARRERARRERVQR